MQKIVNCLTISVLNHNMITAFWVSYPFTTQIFFCVKQGEQNTRCVSFDGCLSALMRFLWRVPDVIHLNIIVKDTDINNKID